MADDPTVIEQKKQTKVLEEIRDIEQKSLEGAEEGAAIAEKKERKERSDKGKTHKRADKSLKIEEESKETLVNLKDLGEKAADEGKKEKKERKKRDGETDEQFKVRIEYEDLKKERADKDSKKRDDQKVDEMRAYKRLEALGWQDVDAMDEMAKKMANGLVLSNEQLIAIGENKDTIAEGVRRAEQKQAEEDAKADAQLVSNMKQEEYLAGLFTFGEWNKDWAERQAKKMMQMKQGVEDWFKDKKKQLASAGMGLLEMLMKGAGLYILYKLFDWLSKQDLKALYEKSKEAFNTLWGGMTALRVGWAMLGEKLKKTKFGKWIAGAFKYMQTFFHRGGGLAKLVLRITRSFGPKSPISAAAKMVLKFVRSIRNGINGIKKFMSPVMKAFGFVSKISGFGGIIKFLKGIMKVFGKLFLPISLLMGAWAAISGGLDEAAEESGGFPQKILSFISGALKGLLDFFIFDLAELIQDGIKWAIGWFMGLFGFSEEEIESATDWDLVGMVKDALFGAIDFVRDIFRFEDTSLKGIFTSLIDIVTAPIGLVINFIGNLFGFTEPDEPFSLGKFITDTIASIWESIKELMNPAKLLSKLNPFSDDEAPSKEELKKEIAELERDVADDSWHETKGERKKDKEELEKLKARLAKMSTGGTILPGGMAIVGEGSMGGELVLNANSAAKVIPAKETADIMAGIGGGPSIAPTTIVNSSSSPVTTYANSSSHNPYSDKYFRN